MPERATLEYYGRQMQPEPSNGSLADHARRLHRGEPTVVILTPGDATMYTLLIVPASVAEHGLAQLGIPPAATRKYLIVSRLTDDGGDAFFASEHVGRWDVHVANAWSRELLAWWLRLLWAEIHAAAEAEVAHV